MTMGEKILSMRKARGWSQEDLAEQVGVTRQAISRWESDQAKPDADNIIVLCDLFGVSADYLLRDLAWGTGDKQTQVYERQENALKKAIRELSLRKWVGSILTLVCGLGLLVFQVLSSVRPCAYNDLLGLPAFLKTYDLEWLWRLLAFGLAVGIWKLFSPKKLKDYPWKIWWNQVWEAICGLITR